MVYPPVILLLGHRRAVVERLELWRVRQLDFQIQHWMRTGPLIIALDVTGGSNTLRRISSFSCTGPAFFFFRFIRCAMDSVHLQLIYQALFPPSGMATSRTEVRRRHAPLESIVQLSYVY